MKKLFNRFVREDQGQDLIEYALLGGFIALVCVAGITTLGNNLSAWYQGVATVVGTITPGAGS